MMERYPTAQAVASADRGNLRGDSDRNAVRTLALGDSLPGVMYISFPASMTAGDHVLLSSGATDGSSTQRFFVGALLLGLVLARQYVLRTR
jgi:hypothetical protein